MKKMLFALLVVVVGSGLAFAGAEQGQHKAMGKPHHVAAEIVSVDVAAKTITFKTEKGESLTAPLLKEAVAEAKTVKPGQKVTLVCQDNEKGEHTGIMAIKPPKAPMPPHGTKPPQAPKPAAK